MAPQTGEYFQAVGRRAFFAEEGLLI